jgi:hypothetical protein
MMPEMIDSNHLKKMQTYIANVGITASALRNLGAPRFVETARKFCANLDLNPLERLDPTAYPGWLDSQTKALMQSFPKKGLWGPARKSINIFMGMASLNRFLCDAYRLERFQDVLEVPLDGEVGRQLCKFGQNRNLFGDGECPKWTTIKALRSTDGEKYQKIAEAMAKELGIPRGRLDVELWRPTVS